MENNNTYFILQHNKNTKIFRVSFQTRQNKKTPQELCCYFPCGEENKKKK